METLLQIEINEIVEIFLNKNLKRISIPDLYFHLKYKDPISYEGLSYRKTKSEFAKLFPLYKNKRKNTKCFKISIRQAKLNRDVSRFRIMPFSQVNIKSYGFTD